MRLRVEIQRKSNSENLCHGSVRIFSCCRHLSIARKIVPRGTFSDAISRFSAVQNASVSSEQAGMSIGLRLRRRNCSTWNNFWRTGTALASFVASSFVFLYIQLRKIMAICALLQRMGILGAERKNGGIFA
jgi:hypothetical protein